MPILLHCPDCAAKIRAPDQIIGRQVRCPKCDAEFTAAVEPPPEPEPEPEAAPPPAPPEMVDPLPPRSEAARPTPPPEDTTDEEELSENDPAYDPAFGPPNPVADILLFRTMIAPVIIQVFFWVGVILCVLTGVVYLIAAIGLLVDGGHPASLALLQGLGALGIIVFGPPVVRIVCELLILFFRIYDTLKAIQAATEKQRRPE